MYSQSDALSLLSAYQPADENEQQAKTFITEFVRRQERYWSRQTLEGHLTASAWITDEAQEKAVLLHHKKLDIWVQPGGHVDDADESLESASLREASEETGLKGIELKSPQIFDLDVHKIPARKGEPDHWHLDVRFWFVARNTTLQISEESNELVWMDAKEIQKITDEESVLRMVRKTLL
jgi:ADP-ribose pyrophosphatase YjhB (NUDIX family)